MDTAPFWASEDDWRLRSEDWGATREEWRLSWSLRWRLRRSEDREAMREEWRLSWRLRSEDWGEVKTEEQWGKSEDSWRLSWRLSIGLRWRLKSIEDWGATIEEWGLKTEEEWGRRKKSTINDSSLQSCCIQLWVWCWWSSSLQWRKQRGC